MTLQTLISEVENLIEVRKGGKGSGRYPKGTGSDTGGISKRTGMPTRKVKNIKEMANLFSERNVTPKSIKEEVKGQFVARISRSDYPKVRDINKSYANITIETQAD